MTETTIPTAATGAAAGPLAVFRAPGAGRPVPTKAPDPGTDSSEIQSAVQCSAPAPGVPSTLSAENELDLSGDECTHVS